MGGWGLLDAPPAAAGWEFPPEEYRRRVEGARRRMAAMTFPARTNARKSQPGWGMNCCTYRTLCVRSKARNVRHAISGSDTRTMPRPSEPKSGLTTTSPPREANASSAASAC